MDNLRKVTLYRKFLTDKGIENLKNHKYKGGIYTPIDNQMNHFWYYCLRFFPETLAPNAITLIGLIVNLSSFAIILFYLFCLDDKIPNWVFFYFAITLFIYQTFDAIDGKQARKLNLSSPLGQLFDHGCDAFQSFILAFIFLVILNTGQNVFLFKSSMLSTIFVFYTSNFAEYFTGVLVTSNNGLGVTEIQFILMFIATITSIFGQEIFLFKIFYWELNFIVLNLILLIAIVNTIPVLIEAHRIAENKNQFFKMLIPISMIMLSIQFLVTERIQGYLMLGYFLGSISFVTNVVKIIVSSMSKMHFKMFHFESYFLLIISVLIRFVYLNSLSLGILLVCSNIVLFVNFFSLAISIILQISKELKIKVLTV